MKTINVIVERGNDNTFSAYMDCDTFDSGIALMGYGNTVEATKKDFYAAYEEAKQILKDKGQQVPEWKFEFRYDVSSFLDIYQGVLSKSGLEKITGIHQKQLWHYYSGRSKPKPQTVTKIQSSIYQFAEGLKKIQLVEQ
ncbi:transcriptional regulator [Bacteroidia bacterium]|nr:transcriptional regulator [Bacteroidia bacterium]